MKRFILAIAAIAVIGLWFVPLAQAVTVNGERQVGASQQYKSYAEPAYSDARVAALEKNYQRLDRQINGPKKGLKKKLSDLDGRQKSLEIRHEKLDGQQKSLETRHEKLRLAYNKAAGIINKTTDRLASSQIFAVIAGLGFAIAFIGFVIWIVIKVDRKNFIVR